MIPVLTLLACSGAPDAPNAPAAPDGAAGAAPLSLVYSHNVDGEIEPCG